MNTRRALLIVACLAVPATAQFRQQLVNDDGQPVNDPNADAVFVRDSGVAAEKLSLAERLEKQKAWDKSADVYAEVTAKFADRVVPSAKDEAGKPTQYVSAAKLVQDRIARWPADGLAAYRKRYEDTARDLLNGNDPAAAAKVAEAYFVTDAGRDASLRLMSDAFERGDFATAAATGRRLLDLHPGLTADRPAVLLRTGLAEHLAGSDANAKKRLDELKGKFPDALARVAGVDTKAADALAGAIAAPVESAGFRSDDWPSAFGSPDAAVVPDQVSAGGARLFGVDLSTPTARPGVTGNLRSYQQAVARDRKLGLTTGVLPSIDGGTLFFQDNARVYAIGLASGLPLPGWQQTYPTARGVFVTDAAPMPRGKQLTVSVTPQSVVALLGQIDPSTLQLGYNPQPPQLVGLDRATGRRLWSTAPQKLRVPDDQANLKDGVFYATPVVADDTVYVLLNANRGGQFEECYVVALRLGDGAYKWSTYVASTSLGNPMYDDGVGGFVTGTAASISAAAGRLYVLTNLGALACLDATAGNVRWLNVYPRNPNAAAERRMAYFQSRLPSGKPFLNGPPIIVDGRVYVMPVDAQSLFVCDAEDGAPLRDLPRKIDPKFPPVQTLLAVLGGKVLLANRATVFELPWESFDPAKSLVDNGGRYYSFPPAKDDKAEPPDSIRGRPFVSANSLIVPTAERLYRVSLKTFKIESEYPAQGEWDADESTGNVLATPDNLIVAGPGRVSVYTDLAAATAKLDARIAADANDVDAYERYAELLFAAGQPKPAVAKLDRAAEHLGGPKGMTPGPARDRLFDIALAYTLKPPRDGDDPSTKAAVFDRAAAAAGTPAQQVRYRLARAAAYRAAGDAAAEIVLHQDILSNAEWRGVTVAGKAGPSTAAAEAESAVAELIRQNGPELYAAYDELAADRLADARADGDADPAALLAIADEFPLSKVTPDAMSDAAETFESSGQNRLATQTLRRLLKRDLSNERRQVTLQALARNYLLSPSKVAIARVRLLQAKALAPSAKLIKPLTLPDGKPMAAETVAAAAAALDGHATRVMAEALPRLGLQADGIDPSKAPFSAAVEVAAAVGVIKQPDELLQSGRVLVWGTDHRVGVVTASSGDVQWTEANPADAPVGGGFVGDVLVVVTPNEVWAADAKGKVLWKLAASALPAIDLTAATRDPVEPSPPGRVVVNQRIFINGAQRGQIRIINGRPVRVADPPDVDAAPPGVERFTQFRLLSDRVVLATGTGRVMAVDLTKGTTAWQNRVNENNPTRLLSNDDFVAVGFIDPNSASEAFVFDAVDGQTVLHKAYDGTNDPRAGGLVNMALSPDGVLVTLQAGRLTGLDLYDPGSGDRKSDSLAARGRPAEPTPFQLSNNEGQLVISADKVLAVYAGITGQQSVHAYDLRTMRPVTATDPRTHREGEVAFGAVGAVGQDGTPVTIAASGKSFYLIGQRSLAAFDLANPDDPGWVAGPGARDRKPTREVVLTRDFVVQIAPAVVANNDLDRPSAVRLSMYSRARTDKGIESGLLVQRPVVKDPAGLIAEAWQVTDGAFYYVSGDQKLKVCRIVP